MTNDSLESSKNIRKEIFIKSGYEHLKVMIDDILYIQSDADYTEIFTPQKRYLSTESLRYWLETLNDNQFARIHKSYILNTAKIEKIVGNQVYLNATTMIPIGRAYKEEFIRSYIR